MLTVWYVRGLLSLDPVDNYRFKRAAWPVVCGLMILNVSIFTGFLLHTKILTCEDISFWGPLKKRDPQIYA